MTTQTNDDKASNKHNIMFVDDEPLVTQSLRILFSKDYNVFTAEGGVESLELVKKHHISVLVSDQRMPVMTGVELLREVKELSPHTIRILMTGYTDLQAIIDSVNVGEIFRYINKPWRVDKLRETIRFACRVSNERAWLTAQKQATQASNSAAPAAKSPANSQEVLLFVDKNPAHLKIFEDFFTPKYKVLTAETAEKAMMILNHNTVSVVSSDVKISHEDGSDFLIVVKERFPNVATVLITDVRDANLAIRMVNEGQVYRYLIKPFPRESLRLTIDAAVLHHTVLKDNPSMNLKLQEQISFSNTKATGTRSFQELLSAVRQNYASRPIY
ncbi:response regulator receiver protein [Chloroherpeton thalassium ATCC 35110]|uniref:Response regulator receiver protein n=1 Tax=Chloroherpeton thalassium (strain ATCC 35110 / GB-78) TaxID=517418 RepID=B3QYA8_CHLT3|nr:response regulator [Chloroherpeton thalassium]ACF15074.1 response regulator receiver protein [Chloroherpeton thalassium ATCC 35110]